MKPQQSEPAPEITRRDALRRMAGACLAVPAALRLPSIHTRKRPRLRVLGTHVTLQEVIREQAARELDLELEFSPGGSASILQQASTRPESFDVFEQWSNTIPLLWQAGAIQGIDTTRIDRWADVNGLAKRGRLTPDTPIGKGDAPHQLLYVQPNERLGDTPSERISFLPYVHNVDSFGYSTATVPPGEPYVEESWGWLLDDAWHGKVALVNEPTIGLFDAALAARAKGLMDFADIGAMTRAELDELFAILVAKKRDGHFFGVWNSVPESVDFMAKGDVVVESMFSPAVSDLLGSGHAVNYAAPREGYRAWQGVMCLSSQLAPETETAAYRYLNWWLSGWPGAVMARQGYYISIPELAREHLTAAEWAYWYEGEAASEPLPGPSGRTAIAAGGVRRGGSYAERFGNIAVWNTVMETYEYSLQRWYEFLTA